MSGSQPERSGHTDPAHGTLGGLGLVEGTLVAVRVAFGAPYTYALLSAITWRLAEFWLPIPLSAIAYLSLRAGPVRP